MSAADIIAAAAAQKDLGWVKVGKKKHKPAPDDPLQLYVLAEVIKTDGTGPGAKVAAKVVEDSYRQPIDFLPQGGGVEVGQVLELTREEVRLLISHCLWPPHSVLSIAAPSLSVPVGWHTAAQEARIAAS
eukprot:SAG22_NODE_61_length_23387_cov_34.380582_16_plen_130_part_00